MKKLLSFVFSLIILVSCTQTNRHSENSVPNRFNREGGIAFMGLRLGLPNDSVKNILQSSENFIIKEFPDIYTRSGHNIFEDHDENEIGTFFCSIVDTNNDSHGGWGIAKSYADSVTTIYFYIPSSYDTDNDSIYERIKPLFVERYGEPDKEYETGFEVIKDGAGYKIVYNDDVETTLYDKGCYWDFANNQRIYLNNVVYLGSKYGGTFSDAIRIEIVYRDMNAVNRIKNARKKQQQQIEQEKAKAENERKNTNRKARDSQQL